MRTSWHFFTWLILRSYVARCVLWIALYSRILMLMALERVLLDIFACHWAQAETCSYVIKDSSAQAWVWQLEVFMLAIWWYALYNVVVICTDARYSWHLWHRLAQQVKNWYCYVHLLLPFSCITRTLDLHFPRKQHTAQLSLVLLLLCHLLMS